MFAGVGVGASFAGVFHLFTHASFKALLFLAAGIVIHGAGGREELDSAAWPGPLFPRSRMRLSDRLAGADRHAADNRGRVQQGRHPGRRHRRPARSSAGYSGGVILTGLYIGRLFAIVYMAAPVDPHAVHHDTSPERLMNWSLVPLMIGSIVFGCARHVLQSRLTAPLGRRSNRCRHPSTPRGLLAFAWARSALASRTGVCAAAAVRRSSRPRASYRRRRLGARHCRSADTPWPRAVARAHTGAAGRTTPWLALGVAAILLLVRVSLDDERRSVRRSSSLVAGAVVVVAGRAPDLGSAVARRPTSACRSRSWRRCVLWLAGAAALALAIVAPVRGVRHWRCSCSPSWKPRCRRTSPRPPRCCCSARLARSRWPPRGSAAGRRRSGDAGARPRSRWWRLARANARSRRPSSTSCWARISLAGLLYGVGLVYLGTRLAGISGRGPDRRESADAGRRRAGGAGVRASSWRWCRCTGARWTRTRPRRPRLAGFVMSASKLAAAFALGSWSCRRASEPARC